MWSLPKILEVSSAFPKMLLASFHQFNEDNAMKLGASLSYYTLFSLPPMLIILISLGGIFFGEDAIRGELVDQISGVVGESSANFIQSTLSNIQISQNSFFATVVSFGILLFTASTVFVEIQSSINFIWGLKPKTNKSILKFFINRLISFSMIASLGFLLMVSLVLNSILQVISKRLLNFLNMDQLNVVFMVNNSIVFLVICLLFAIILKTLPDAKIRWKDAFVGSVFTSLLFMLGKYLIGLYLSTTNMGSFYGAAASVVVLMTWVYYSAIILYFGAEFTKVYTEQFGQKIRPNDYSVMVTKQEVEIVEKGDSLF